MWPPDSAEIPVTRRHSFPGLQRGDAGVLAVALGNPVILPDRMWLNVPVGNPPGWTNDSRLAPFAHRLQQIYQRRVDLVTLTGDRLDVVEIKPLGSPTAVGQALLYRHLANLAEDRIGDARATILADAMQPDLYDLCRFLGIRVLEIHAPENRPVPQSI